MGRRERGGRGGREEKKGNDKPKNYVNVASVKENDNGTYVAVNNDYKKKDGTMYEAPGRLLFEDFETGKIYQLKSISIFDPHENAPQNILNNLTINTENENQCEDVSEEFLE